MSKNPDIIGANQVRQMESQSHNKFNGPHDCGPRAVSKLMPALDAEQVEDAFVYCTKKWPYGPVINKEMNVALRYLGVYEMFDYREYLGSNIKRVKDFRDLDGEFILLMKGHFTVIAKRKVADNLYGVSFNELERVYFSWQLLKDVPNN